MSNFVYDLTTLPGSKTDLVPTPPGADLSKYLPAAHWNEHIQASYDVRAALRTGVFQGLAEQASDPAPSDADAYWWLQNTGVMRLVGPTAFHFGGTITAAEPTLSTHLATRNYVDTHASISPLTAKGDLYTRTATVDARFPVGTAGQLLSVNLATTTGLEWIAPPTTVKTLQGAYTDGGAGPQIINLSTSGKGLKIRDTLAGIGEALFAVQNSTGVTSHFAVNSDGTVTMAGALTVTGVVIGATPTLATHLTTKGYVDGLITGLSWKAMVKYASTVAGGNVTLSGDQAIDGFTTTELDRVLLKNQTNHIENGIWVAHTGAAWTRAIDLPAGSDAATTACFVDLGTLNQDTSWFCYTDKPLDIVGTDAIDFQIFSNTISQHNALTGLDGGTSGQYYHLTSAEHVGLHGIATGGVTFASSTGVLATDASNFFWDNSAKRLGINSASPQSTLYVNAGTLTSGVGAHVVATNSGTAYTAHFALHSPTADNPVRLNFGDDTNGLTAQIEGTGVAGGGFLRFITRPAGGGTPAERMRILNDGKLGVGIANPSYPFQFVYSNAGGLFGLQNTSASGTTGVLCWDTSGVTKTDFGYANGSWGDARAGKSYWYHNGVDFTVCTGSPNPTIFSLTVKSDGKIGFGTTAPANPFNFRYSGAATHKVVGINRNNSDVAAWYLGDTGSPDYNGMLATNNSDLIIGHDVGGTFTETMRVTKSGTAGVVGKVGIGTTSPTALLHLKAGTTAASTAPLKLTSGDLMTAPEAGAIEFLSDKFYGTITTGTVRSAFVFETRSVSTGTGLSGGGDLSANRTLTLDQAVIPTWTGAHTFTGGVTFKNHSAFAGSGFIPETRAIQTTTVTPAVLWSKTLADDTLYWVEVRVIGRDTAGVERAYYGRTFYVYRQNPGGAVLGNVIELFSEETDADWDVGVNVNTNDVEVKVTGKSSVTINWAGTVTMQAVSGNA